MERKSLALVIIVFFILPTVYLNVLNTLLPHKGLELRPIWIDDSYITTITDFGWSTTNFTTGWFIGWVMGATNTDYGFIGKEGEGVLYFTFTGQRQGIEIRGSINVDTRIYKYLEIKYQGSSMDPALVFSVGLFDEQGNWHGAPWQHLTTSLRTLVIDLGSIYLGKVNMLTIAFTNDFNYSYAGGLQAVYIKFIGFGVGPPAWTLSDLGVFNATISSYNGTLKVEGTILPSNHGKLAIVSAKRTDSLNIDILKAPFLKFTFKTSDIDVTVRVVIWTNQTNGYVVFKRIYQPGEWVQVVINLSDFGINTPTLYMIELGWESYSIGHHIVWFGPISFNELLEKS